MKPSCWYLLTGEYPPDAGGVADYTENLAQALARNGVAVTVLAPAGGRVAREERRGGVRILWLPGHFGGRARRAMGEFIEREPPGGRVLMQYVPHAFGGRGMNLAFVFWLWRQRRRLAVWVMFHEVAYPLIPGQPVRHRFLAHVQQMMARVLVRAAARVFVSIPAWRDFLVGIGAHAEESVWLPIPSNLPTAVDAAEVAAFRAELGLGAGRLLVGHFGTYGPLHTPLLEEVLVPVLTRDAAATVLLLGKGSDVFAGQLQRRNPTFGPRLLGTGGLAAGAVACRIAACDLMVQPYVDGISSRRTTAMAALALGVPIISNLGHLSESIWRESGCVALAARPEAEEFAPLLKEVMSDAAYRQELGTRGQRLYAERFSIERTVEILNRGAAADGRSASPRPASRVQGRMSSDATP